jgi:hypothetical protein
MKMFLPFKKASLLIPSGTNEDPTKKHLFILLTDSVDIQSVGSNILVPVNSYDGLRGQDATCILSAGDHKFIKHVSFIVYAKMRDEQTDKLLNAVKEGTFIGHEPLSDDVFNKIIQGVTTSEFTPPKYLKYF